MEADAAVARLQLVAARNEARDALPVDGRVDQHAGAILSGLTQTCEELLGTLIGTIVEDDGVEALAIEQF